MVVSVIENTMLLLKISKGILIALLVRELINFAEWEDLHIALWVWGRSLAPRVSSITNTQLQRRPAIPPNAKNKHEIFAKQLRPGINTSLVTTNLCLPSTAWQWNVVCYYFINKFWPRNDTENSLLIICLCLDVWLCLKMGSENLVLVKLLQRGAKDLTVTGGVN